MGLAVDFRFAILHGKRSPSGMCWFGKTHYTAKCRPLLRLSDHEISLIIPSLHITDGDVQRNATNSLQPCLLRHFLMIPVDIYATRGLTGDPAIFSVAFIFDRTLRAGRF